MKKLYLCLAILLSSSQAYCLTTVSPAQFNAINVFSDMNLIVLGTLFVLLMQVGFAVIEGGYVKNSKTIYNLGISYLSAILGNALYVIFCFLLVFFGVS